MYYFILNPQASSGKGVAVWGKLKPILKERNVPYCLAVFNRREDVSMFVKALTSEKEPKLSKLLLTADKMSEINGEFEYRTGQMLLRTFDISVDYCCKLRC